jgi:hypothetical protein
MKTANETTKVMKASDDLHRNSTGRNRDFSFAINQ